MDAIDVQIVYNKKPIHPGCGNINMQLASTLGGVNRAIEMGCSHILKTRADQRIYRDDFLEFFLNMLRLFPTGDIRMQNRLLGVNCSRLCVPFYVSDFMMFGDCQTIHQLYSIPFRMDPDNLFIAERKTLLTYQKEVGDWELEEKDNVAMEKTREFMKKCMPSECYIIYQFLKYNYMEISLEKDDLIEKSFEALRKYFIIVDTQQIGLYWKKYIMQYSAIQGAEKTIKKFRPKLAICIYHKPADLFTIPALIKEYVPEYKLYIRHHEDSRGETVLYASL